MIGKNVWTLFGNHVFRCGKVIEEDTCDGWKYVKVEWIDDDGFEVDRQRVIRLRGYDMYSDWYRLDKLHVFDKDALINKISKL